MRLGHYDPWVESHMWPQQMWGQRLSRGQWPLVQVFEKRSLYSHTLMYFYGTWIQWSLGSVTYVTSTKVRLKVILGSLTFWLNFLKNSHCIYIFWCITMGVGLILQWLPKYVIAKAGETRDSRTALFDICTVIFLIIIRWTVFSNVYILLPLNEDWVEINLISGCSVFGVVNLMKVFSLRITHVKLTQRQWFGEKEK